MSQIHSLLGWPIVAINGVAALWALAAHWIESARVRTLWVVTFVGQALIAVEAFIGAATLASVGDGRPGFHMFYGFLALTGVMMLYAYRSYDQLAEYRYLLYGAGGLFVTGLLIRTVLLNQ